MNRRFLCGLLVCSALLSGTYMLSDAAKPKKAPETTAAVTPAADALPDSIQEVIRLANGGDDEAQNHVGSWYYTGKYFDRDYNSAARWFAKSAEQGNAKAIANLGVCYHFGHGVDRDSLRAVKLYEASLKKGNKRIVKLLDKYAADGDLFANSFLARVYQKGIGVKKNLEMAVPYLTVVADSGNVMAQRDLGVLLLNCKQPKKAYGWFEKAAGQGNINSIFYVGRLLLEGKGVEQDKRKGAELVLQTANEGFPQGMLLAGRCYFNGDGLAKNPETAVKWFKKAAGKNVTNAMWALATCYREGTGTPVDYDRALTWYAASVANGLKFSFMKLFNDSIPVSPFVTYMKGVKDYRDGKYEDAMKKFRALDKENIPDVKVRQARILADTAYSKYDPKKAVKMLEKCGDHPAALYRLATHYENGTGVKADRQKALELLKKASDLGYEWASVRLGDAYFEGNGVEQDYYKAVEYYTKAVENGLLSKDASERYAECYEKGLGGLEADAEKATAVRKSRVIFSIDNTLSLLKE